MSVTRASIVIPAHNEAAVIGRCLRTLSVQPEAGDLEVVVVANGCHDDTVEVTRTFSAFFARLIVLDLPAASKAVALNAGDEVATAFPRVYLDADIELAQGAIAQLLVALSSTQPTAAAPRVEFVHRGASAWVKLFYRAYEQTPYVKSNLIGLGVYALNEAGRARFTRFPELTADDLFVQHLFEPNERRVVDSTFAVRIPRTLRNLLRVRTRIVRGNNQHQELTEEMNLAPSSSTRETVQGLLKASAKDPALLPALALYIGVIVAARLRAKQKPRKAWGRDDSSRLAPQENTVTRVAYLVSQYPAPSHTFIERELSAVRKQQVEVHSFSVRDTAEELLLTDVMRKEAKRTTVLQIPRPVFVACLRRTIKNPGAVSAAVSRALRTGPAGVRPRVWQLFYLAQGMHLLRHMRRLDLTHVHAHFANNGADIARATIALARDVDPSKDWTWTFSMHGPTEFENVERHDLAAKVESARGVACITDYARSQLMRLSPPESWDKLDVVPMSVDMDRFLPVQRIRLAGSPFRVLFVGRLVAEKGPSVLLEALNHARRAGVPVEARIVGGGPLEDVLAQEVDARGLASSVTLLGVRGQDEILGLYEWADALCLPSFQEGLPVVLMEAMATGLPVVTTPIAGIPELVKDGVNGLLVSPGRGDQLYDALLRLALNPQLRDELGARGRVDVVARHSMVDAGRAQAAFLASTDGEGHKVPVPRTGAEGAAQPAESRPFAAIAARRP